MKTFEQMGLKKEILDAIGEMGFEQPTSIQEKAIPIIISSQQDIIGRAQTGTGKTGAFGLAILQKLNLKLPLKKFTLFYCDQHSGYTTNKIY